MEKIEKYELVIIGAGPAGLSASIYAARFGIKHIVLGNILGGTISETHLIDNYPGIEDVSGFDFSQRLVKHAQKYGTQILPVLAKKIIKTPENTFEIELGDGNKIFAQTILLANGTKRKKLGIKGEEVFLGKGVSYCATCDGPFYKNKRVAVIGGSNSAASAAVYLAGLAEKVYLIYRKEKLRAEDYWVKLIQNNQKIEVLFERNVLEIRGEKQVSEVELDKEFAGQNNLSVQGVFIEIGSDPSVDFAKELRLEVDKDGYIKIQKDTASSVAGVWAAGDITDGSDKFFQVITAAAEGAIAARSIYMYLKKN
jgi:thioredoxin reductase (NADPH)